MWSTRVVAVSLLALPLAPGCMGTGGGDCSYGPAQGPTEPCCSSYGIDACAGGFFCAALDGHTIATCWANNSRLNGQSCTASEQCALMQCGTTSHVCVGDGSNGADCGDDADCDAGMICDPTAHVCGHTSNLGTACMYSRSGGSRYSAGCSAPSGMSACFPTRESGASFAGYCVPAGGHCDGTLVCEADMIEAFGRCQCLTPCTTADDCPLPELGCRGGRCAGCSIDSQCRTGQHCTTDSFGGLCS